MGSVCSNCRITFGRGGKGFVETMAEEKTEVNDNSFMEESKTNEETNEGTNEESNEESTSNASNVPYCECDIYKLYNEMEDASTLIVDVRSATEFRINHISKSEHFDIPDDFVFNTLDDLNKLGTNILEFQKTVHEKLKKIKKADLLIICYGNNFIKTKTMKFIVLYQLSLKFGLEKKQLQILSDPGFISFEEKYPFLCSKYIHEQELQKGSEFGSILDALRYKNKPKDDGTFYGKIKSSDRKYPNSIICDKLYLGNGEHSRDLKVLQELRITHIINATLKFKNEFESFGEMKYLQLAIDDTEQETFEPFWDKIMNFMKCIDDDDDNEEEKDVNLNNHKQNRIFVHCEMGISRSATIIIAYLMNKLQISLYDAYFYALDRRKVIRPNGSFLKQLEKYEKRLFNGQSTLEKVEKEIRQIYLTNLSKEQQ